MRMGLSVTFALHCIIGRLKEKSWIVFYGDLEYPVLVLAFEWRLN